MRLSSALKKQLDTNSLLTNRLRPVVNPEMDELRYKYENSLHAFTKASWPIIEGNRDFVDGFHLHALAEHLEAVYYGHIKNLLINIPPGTGKSTTLSSCFTPWCWTKNASLRFLYLSYALGIAKKDSVRARRIIDSRWYQQLWGNKYQLTGDVNTTIRFDTNRSGHRITAGIQGSATGDGGDFVIVDDPNNAREAESDLIREKTNDIGDFVLTSRLRDLKKGGFVVIQQRLHHQDYSGHILSKNMDDLVHLFLPMEFEKSRRCSTIILPSTEGIVWSDPRTKEGQLLWPEHIGPVQLKRIKDGYHNNEYVIAGQLQQRPAPSTGGMFKRHWMRMWKEAQPPECSFVLQSWDTAFGGEKETRDPSETAYSACTTWGVFNYNNVDHVMLLDFWKGKVEYPELRQMAQRLSLNYHDTDLKKPWSANFTPDLIIVEAKANGISLIQDLRRAGVLATPFNPTRHGSKEDRARRISHYFECGRVWLGGQPPHFTEFRPYAEEFIQAALHFPKDTLSKDIIDSTSQAFIRLSGSGYLGHRDDEIYTPTVESLMQQAKKIHSAASAK